MPHFPGEDDKLRATAMQVRRGGNCPNSIEVMQQLDQSQGSLKMHLVSCLPDRMSPAAAMVAQSLGATLESPALSTCIFRAGYANPASCYIIRSAATGSRTIVNHNDLPEMTVDEFKHVVTQIRSDVTDNEEWWHFEGRVPETLLGCFHYLRDSRKVTISLEVEKPGREGLRALAELADIVFYSKTWAESEGYTSGEACLKGEVALMRKTSLREGVKDKILFCTWGARGASAWHADTELSVPAPHVPADKIVDAVGAGDTFTAGILYKLSTRPLISPPANNLLDTVREALEYAVSLASRKIQLDGFQGLA